MIDDTPTSTADRRKTTVSPRTAKINAHYALPYEERCRIDRAICAFMAAQSGQPPTEITIAEMRDFIASLLYRPLVEALRT